jgi:hypothetical protein
MPDVDLIRLKGARGAVANPGEGARPLGNSEGSGMRWYIAVLFVGWTALVYVLGLATAGVYTTRERTFEVTADGDTSGADALE